MKNVSESIKSREEVFGLHDTLLQEQWRRDDDKQRLLRETREQELKQLEEDARMSAMQEDLAVRMQRLQLERDAKVRSGVYCEKLCLCVSIVVHRGAAFNS